MLQLGQWLGANHEDELVHLLILAADSPAECSVLDHCNPSHDRLQGMSPPLIIIF